MSEISKEAVFILRGLYLHNKVGNLYTNEHNVFRLFPPRKRNRTLFKKWIKELRNEGLILVHKNGECISLNKHRLGEIERLIATCKGVAFI